MICKNCEINKQSGYFGLKKLFSKAGLQVSHPVFHATSFENAEKILSGGFKARAGGPQNDAYQDNSICFSRYLCFSETASFGGGQVIFVLDLNKLKTRFKNYAIDWYSNKNQDEKYHTRHEYEERISRSPKNVRDESEEETIISPKYIEAILVLNSDKGKKLWAEWGGRFPVFIRTDIDKYIHVENVDSFEKDPAMAVRNLSTDSATLVELLSRASTRMTLKILKHPNLNPDVLYRYAESGNIEVIKTIAGLEHTPQALIKRLSVHPDSNVRAEVADNLSTPLPVLKKLSTDPDSHVRNMLVKHPNLSQGLINAMSKDDDTGVRFTVARRTKNKNLLAEMSKDSNRFVRENVVTNPITPNNVIIDMSHREHDPSVIDRLLKISTLPKDIKQMLIERYRY